MVIENPDVQPDNIKQNSKARQVHKKRVFSKYGNIAAIIAVIIFSVITVPAAGCAADINSTIPEKPENAVFGDSSDTDQSVSSGMEGTVKVLTQNTMLIPFSFVAPAYRQRTYGVIDLILDGYEIIGLQEVFAGNSQNQIVSAWHNKIYNKINSGTSAEWENDYFNNWYGSLQQPDKEMWLPLTSAIDVAELSEQDSRWGVEVINCKPNRKEARLVCSPYYVMGPDCGRLSVKQDGGLVILSGYPIIGCSAFSFSESSGTDMLANKGVIYARIQIGQSEEDYIHVFNTHLQSHDYSETRLKNLEELLDFIEMVIEPEEKNYHPILIMGDFNVAAEVNEGWMEASGIVSPPDEYGQNGNFDSVVAPSPEYEEFCRKFKNFTEADLEGKIYLKDVWLDLKSDDPGFTWIGKDWNTGSESSYDDLGNRIAVETGGPQRIDYIFYFGGSGNPAINPESIHPVPESPDILYSFDTCFFRQFLSNVNRYIRTGNQNSCSLISYTVSDHIGLEADFSFKIIK